MFESGIVIEPENRQAHVQALFRQPFGEFGRFRPGIKQQGSFLPPSALQQTLDVQLAFRPGGRSLIGGNSLSPWQSGRTFADSLPSARVASHRGGSPRHRRRGRSRPVRGHRNPPPISREIAAVGHGPDGTSAAGQGWPLPLRSALPAEIARSAGATGRRTSELASSFGNRDNGLALPAEPHEATRPG